MTGHYDPARARTPPAYRGMRVGLLGGSFNPAHVGHLHISKLALARLGLHRVWWIVTPGNPLKCHTGLPGLADRMAQARAVARHPRIEVTGFEAGLPTTYAVDTVNYLLRRHADVRFVWLMGADNLAQFHHWRKWRSLFNLLPILVMDRPTARLSALASPAAQTFGHARFTESAAALPYLAPPAWAYLNIPLSAVSSTAIRASRSNVAAHAM